MRVHVATMPLYLYCRVPVLQCVQVVTVPLYLYCRVPVLPCVQVVMAQLYPYCRVPLLPCVQVVTAAVYLFLLACLMGRQSLEQNPSGGTGATHYPVCVACLLYTSPSPRDS